MRVTVGLDESSRDFVMLITLIRQSSCVGEKLLTAMDLVLPALSISSNAADGGRHGDASVRAQNNPSILHERGTAFPRAS